MKSLRSNSLSPSRSHRVVFITTASFREAGRLARGILQKKLAACINVVPQIRSWYWWKGKVTSGSEVLLVVKTKKSLLRPLHAWVRAHHSYELPEFISLPIAEGDASYLKWLSSSTINY